MKSITSVIIIGIIMATMIFAMPVIGDDIKNIETRAKLETLIDRYIVSCGAKSELLNSRSDVIRKSAIRSCRIADFCLTSREVLIKAMLENNIEPKHYKVSRFLNEKFQITVLAKE
jgi:uncharacterized protein (UPF0333 family)